MPNEVVTSASLTPEQVQAQLAEFDRAGKEEVKSSAPELKDALEQNKNSEPDTEETEVEGEAKDESEDSAEADEDSDESKDTEKGKPKKKGGFQRRIDKLNAAKSEFQREAEYWKRM